MASASREMGERPDPATEIRMTTLHSTRGANYWSRRTVTRVDIVVGAYSSDLSIAAIFPDAQAQLEANQFRGDFLLVVHDTPCADAAAADLIATADEVGLSTLELSVLDGLKTNSAAGALRRSDHAPFWDVDEPALQLTDTADYRNPHYHCQGGPDAVADLDFGFATQVVQATVGAAAAALDR